MSSKFSSWLMSVPKPPKVCISKKKKLPPQPAPQFAMTLSFCNWQVWFGGMENAAGTLGGELEYVGSDAWELLGLTDGGDPFLASAVIPPGGGAFTLQLTIETDIGTGSFECEFLTWDGTTFWSEGPNSLVPIAPNMGSGDLVMTSSG